MYPLRVGDLECAVLDDGDLVVTPETIFPPSRRADWPRVELNAEGRVVLSINCLLVRSCGQTILVDTGNGTKPGTRWPGGGRLLEDLKRAGVEPGDVDIVLIAHTHGDHVAGTTILREGRLAPTFPRARHLMTRQDWEYHTAPERAETLWYVPQAMLPLAEWGLVDLVEMDASITEELRLLPAPGHSPGQSMVVVASRGETLVYIGDLVHHPSEFERPDLVRDHDPMRELVPPSREKVYRFALEQSALLLGAHLRYPGLGRLVPKHGGVTFLPTG